MSSKETTASEIWQRLIWAEALEHNVRQLETLPEGIFEAQKRVVECEMALKAFEQGELAKAREWLEAATLTASLNAPQDGKNAEVRKAQLDRYLLNDPGMVNARSDLRAAEKQRLTLEFDLDMAKASLDLQRETFRAALQIAALQTSMLNGK